MTLPTPYRGRFAPSPTGPLHFGSLIAATGSYLMARSQQGEWLLRIENVDPPREVAGASDSILRVLEAFGFEWDGPVTYQIERTALYQDAITQLQARGHVYPCSCTRKRIAETQAEGRQGIYPGTCRRGLPAGQTARMLRINTEETHIEFHDRLQGHRYYALGDEIGDFVVLRADGLIAYQMATAMDDALQGITEVVRGVDLLDSTPCQIFIHRQLDYQSPAYCHLPIVVNEQGQKLSKQNLAPALDAQNAPTLLWQALEFLGQSPPRALLGEPVETLWQWAKQHWRCTAIPRQCAIPQPDIAR